MNELKNFAANELRDKVSSAIKMTGSIPMPPNAVLGPYLQRMLIQFWDTIAFKSRVLPPSFYSFLI